VCGWTVNLNVVSRDRICRGIRLTLHSHDNIAANINGTSKSFIAENQARSREMERDLLHYVQRLQQSKLPLADPGNHLDARPTGNAIFTLRVDAAGFPEVPAAPPVGTVMRKRDIIQMVKLYVGAIYGNCKTVYLNCPNYWHSSCSRN